MGLATVSLNGVPIENYGVAVQGLTDWISLPKRNFKTVDLAMRDGQKLQSPASSSDPRTLGISVTFYPSSLQNRRDLANAFFRAMAGLIEIVTVEDPTKACYGVLQTGPASFVGASALAVLPTKADLAFLCADPLWYDLTPQTRAIALPATDVALLLSPASARIRRALIRVSGAVSGPFTLTLKNLAGDTLALMTISVSLTSAEYLDVDCDAFTLTKYSGGVATDVTAALDETQDFFAFDPQDEPTLRLDQGSAMVYLNRAFVA